MNARTITPTDQTNDLVEQSLYDFPPQPVFQGFTTLPTTTIKSRKRFAAIGIDYNFPPPQVDVAGYRTIAQQVEAVMLAGAIHTLNKSIENGDYDTDLLATGEKETDLKPRLFTRFSEFDEIKERGDRLQDLRNKYEAVQEQARKAQYDRINDMQAEHAELLAYKKSHPETDPLKAGQTTP